MHRFVGVLLEFDTAVNPEPGVARAPTASEQAMALARLAERLGGTLEPELFIARRGEGLDAAALDRLERQSVDGVLLFSLDTVRHGSQVDLEGLRVFVDIFSKQYLENVQIDYVSNVMGSGFTFNNPNAQGGCGCGSSFSA